MTSQRSRTSAPLSQRALAEPGLSDSTGRDSPGKATDPAIVAQVKTLLENIGKVPVVCAATPGFIVPRIQALAMNEAARMVEEGVASAEDIDRAIRYGFGFTRCSLLEFIDWAAAIFSITPRYLEGALGSDRYRAPG
jgi:3-hydroxybutyryl-CoA dehydrogenase